MLALSEAGEQSSTQTIGIADMPYSTAQGQLGVCDANACSMSPRGDPHTDFRIVDSLLDLEIRHNLVDYS